MKFGVFFSLQVLVSQKFAKCIEVDIGGIDDGINGPMSSKSSSNNFSINPDHYDEEIENASVELLSTDANTTENDEDEEEISGNKFDH